jgi:hypothetical protein
MGPMGQIGPLSYLGPVGPIAKHHVWSKSSKYIGVGVTQLVNELPTSTNLARKYIAAY